MLRDCLLDTIQRGLMPLLAQHRTKPERRNCDAPETGHSMPEPTLNVRDLRRLWKPQKWALSDVTCFLAIGIVRVRTRGSGLG